MGLFFILFAVLIRLPSFWVSVMDHDESTYLVMGAGLVNGQELYTDMTDTKPAGIFLIYAFLQLVTGYSIFWKRFIVAVIVGLSAFLLNRISRRFFRNGNAALAAGIIYVVFTSTWAYFGLSPNTELFFNFFTLAGLLFFLKGEKFHFFLAGFMFGCGFMVKYLVLFDYMAIGGFFMVLSLMEKKKLLSWSVIQSYVVSGIGFLVPFGLAHVYFWLNGNFSDFHFITYQLTDNYNDSATLWSYIKLLLDFTGRFLPVFFLFWYVMFSRNLFPERWHKPFFIVWLVAILTAIYLPGKGFSHYAIQLMVPVSLVSGLFYHSEFRPGRYSALLFRGRPAVIMGILFLGIVLGVNIHSHIVKPDYPREIAEYLDDRTTDQETIYTGNYRQVIYYLLEKSSPTKFVHPTILSTGLGAAFRVNTLQEIRRILGKRPKYIIIERDYPLLEKEMRSHYRQERTFKNNRIRLYRRIDNAGVRQEQ